MGLLTSSHKEKRMSNNTNNLPGAWLVILRATGTEGILEGIAGFSVQAPHAEDLCRKTFDHLRWAQGPEFAVVVLNDVPLEFNLDNYERTKGGEPLMSYRFDDGMWVEDIPVGEKLFLARELCL